MIRRLNRAVIAGQRVEIFKPALDRRYSATFVVSHNKTQLRSTPVDFAADMLLPASASHVIGIDEAQFFDASLVETCTKLAGMGKRVVVAGLDKDFLGRPFPPVNDLMAVAEFVTKTHAICMKCGNPASFSLRLHDSRHKVLLGEKDQYEARCRKCFYQDLNNRN